MHFLLKMFKQNFKVVWDFVPGSVSIPLCASSKFPMRNAALGSVLFYCCNISTFRRIQYKTVIKMVNKTDKQPF